MERPPMTEEEIRAARYEAAKRELAARTWRYVQNYADAKTAVVEAIVTRVLDEAP